MTYEEAVQDFKDTKIILESNGAENYFNNIGRNIAQCDIAIECIEKQIPKKPNRSKDKWYGNIVLTSIPPKHYWDCPNCESIIGWDKQHNYCPNCGQAIDWSEVEE